MYIFNIKTEWIQENFLTKNFYNREKSQGINCTNGHKYICFIENILIVLHIKSANLFHFILKIKVKNLIWILCFNLRYAMIFNKNKNKIFIIYQSKKIIL